MEREVLALDMDVAGQPANRDAKFGCQEDESTHNEDDDAPEHQESADVFHLKLSFQVSVVGKIAHLM